MRTVHAATLSSYFEAMFLTCDPPYDFRAKGDSTFTTCFHLKTKETGYNTLAEDVGAYFNELMLLFHVTHFKQYSVCHWTIST